MSETPTAYKITYKMEGISKITQALERVNARLYDRTTQSLRNNMQAVVDRSRAEAEGRGWRLAKDIMVGIIEPLAVEGGCYAWYAGFPEFGTINYAARPYWRPFVWQQYFQLMRELSNLQRELMLG